MSQPHLIVSAFRTTIPVMMGYVPLGIAFGVLFADLGFHWLYAGLMGVFIFAGTAQFLSVGLLANQAGLFEVFAATLLLNFRHIFYGLSLLNQFPSRGLRRWYMIFGLTDETYSLLTSTSVQAGYDPVQFKFYITLFNQCSWVIGCIVGAWLGSNINYSTAGIEFVLPALFTVLVIEQYKQVPLARLFIMALLLAISTLFISEQQMLLVSCCLVVAFLIFSKGWFIVSSPVSQKEGRHE